MEDIPATPLPSSPTLGGRENTYSNGNSQVHEVLNIKFELLLLFFFFFEDNWLDLLQGCSRTGELYSMASCVIDSWLPEGPWIRSGVSLQWGAV